MAQKYVVMLKKVRITLSTYSMEKFYVVVVYRFVRNTN